MTPSRGPMPSGVSAYVYDADATYRTAVREGINDLIAGLAMHSVWIRLGWRDMRQQTHRTLLGPIWSIIGTTIQVVTLGYVYGALLDTKPTDTFPYVAAGLIIWFLISGSILGGLSVFLNFAGLMKETDLPISLAAYRYVFRLFVEFALKFIVFIGVALWAGLAPNWNTLLAIPAAALYVLNGVWVIILLGVAGARYWDLRELVGPLMLIAFLATPVLWHPDALPTGSYLALLNPMTHFLDIMREPLLGHAPSLLAYQVVIVISLIGWLALVAVFGPARNRIIYWL